MLRYETQVSWIMIAALALSAVYELYRSTVKAGTSKYDSIHGFLTQELPFYAIAFPLAALVRTGWRWVAWTTLVVGGGADPCLDLLLQPDHAATTTAGPN